MHEILTGPSGATWRRKTTSQVTILEPGERRVSQHLDRASTARVRSFDDVFNHLQIYDSRERLIVGCADAVLRGCAAAARLRPSKPIVSPPRRILLLRLERIGDLLITLGAIDAVRTRAPGAAVHLVVGSWNASLAPLVPGIDSWETLDAPWLARENGAIGASALIGRARAWRKRRFDLALNFEPDIRTNLLLALSGAPCRVGFSSGGGAAFLTKALAYVRSDHAAVNALRLVDAALPAAPGAVAVSRFPQLAIPDEARRQAGRLLSGPNGRRLLVGIHASGGREIKQWHPERFAQVATRLARELGATIVLTGTREDKPLVEHVISRLPADVPTVDMTGSMDLPVFGGLLEKLDLFVSSDTGPMHLAAAVGTRVVALFGPSDPDRYGPLSSRARIVTADLWCRPCGRVRRPPARCVGRVPDCLDGIDVETVCDAARELLSDKPVRTAT